MSDQEAFTTFNLLTDDGIIHVAFACILTHEQYRELLEVSNAESVHALEKSLLALGMAWGVMTVTKIVSRKPKELGLP